MPTLRRGLIASGPRSATVELTCAEDGLTHRVDEATYAAASAHLRGRHRAVCGHVVLAAALVTPPSRRCFACFSGR